jgi:thymidylate kinase
MAKKPRVVIISGVDGSGKTSVIEAVKTELERQGNTVNYAWLRYNHYLTKFLLAFCKFTGFTQYEYYENSRVVYHNFHKSKVISWLFIILTWIDTFFSSLVKVYIPLRFSKKTIICDRWVYDIMVDLETDTRIMFEPECFHTKIFKWLLPAESKSFLIMRDYEKIRQTRDESMNDSNFEVRFMLYKRHASDPDLMVVDNDGELAETVAFVVRTIS